MSTYADYVALKKRQVIATTFTQNPPPLARRNNTIITTVMANKASVYEKVPYSLTPAPGTPFGPAYVTPGVLPRKNNCCIQPSYTPITPAVYSLSAPDLTGTTNNAVTTFLTASFITNNNNEGTRTPVIVFDSVGNMFYYSQDNNNIYKIPLNGGSYTVLVNTGTALYSNILIDSQNYIYYAPGGSTGSDFKKVNTSTGAVTTFVSGSTITALTGGNPNYWIMGLFIDDSDNVYALPGVGSYIKMTPAGVASSTGVAGSGLAFFSYNKTNKKLYGYEDPYAHLAFSCTGGVLGSYTSTPILPEKGYAYTVDPTGQYEVYFTGDGLIRAKKFTDSTSVVIAGSGTVGYADGSAGASKFGSTSGSIYTDIEYSPDGSLYFADPANNAIRKINKQTLVTPAIPAVFPKAGALI